MKEQRINLTKNNEQKTKKRTKNKEQRTTSKEHPSQSINCKPKKNKPHKKQRAKNKEQKKRTTLTKHQL